MTVIHVYHFITQSPNSTNMSYKKFTEQGKDFGNTKVTNVKKTDYGYRVRMFNNYITLFYLKIIVNKNGSAKIHWEVKKNYFPVERYTTYYDVNEKECSRAQYQDINKKVRS